MAEAALAALPLETAFNISVEFIKSGGEDGKGTGASNAFGQNQEGRKNLYKWFKQASEGDIKGERPGLMAARRHGLKHVRHGVQHSWLATRCPRRHTRVLLSPHSSLCTGLQATMKAGGPIAGAEVLMKYDAWASVKGTSRDEAMKSYLAEIVSQCATYERDEVLARFVADKS